eukprot:1385216-Rhodomonas_salina.1
MQSGDGQWATGGWGNPPDMNPNMAVHGGDGMHGSLQQPAKQWGFDHNHNMSMPAPQDHASFDATIQVTSLALLTFALCRFVAGWPGFSVRFEILFDDRRIFVHCFAVKSASMRG